jgi:hypothetical protein
MSTLANIAYGLTYKNGAFKSNETGRKVTPKKIYSEYRDLLQPGEEFLSEVQVLESLTESIVSREKEYREEALEDTKYPSIFTIAEFIEQSIEVSGYHVDQRGESIKKGVDNASYEDLENACMAHRVRYMEDSPRDEKGKPLRMIPSTGDIKVMLQDWLRSRDFTSRCNLREKLVFEKDCAAQVDKDLREVLKLFTPKTPLKLSVYVLKQWCWQVKRFLYGMEVKAPLLVNIYGEGQGTGKTTLTEELTKVFGSYRQNADLSQAMDTRHNKLWTENYVILFDELAKADGEGGRQTAASSKASLSVLKFLLTSKEIAQRDMGRTRFTKGSRTFSAFSSSNVPVSEILFDPTGMRRFFEIEILADIKKEGGLQQTLDRVEAMKKVDWLSLWKGIDENLEEGYIVSGTKLWEQMIEIQNGYKKPDNLDFLYEIAESEGVEHLPIHNEGELFETVEKMVQEELSIQAIQEQAAVILSTATQFYVDIKEDWAGQDYRDEIRWIPKDMKLIARAKQKGWGVVQIGDTWYIVREKVSQIPEQP